MKVLKSLARRKKVSMAGLLTSLVLMADRQKPELGIIDLDWDKIRKESPTQATRAVRTWDAVMISVGELAKEFETAEEIAMHSRWTVAQCRRALLELAK
jgi:hypothetical protein